MCFPGVFLSLCRACTARRDALFDLPQKYASVGHRTSDGATLSNHDIHGQAWRNNQGPVESVCAGALNQCLTKRVIRTQLNNDALSGRNAEMKPVTFDECFGWLHEGVPSAARGVVLCQPFGREAMWVHKGWRVLAENLAAAGSPTLRFDYAGTGDSAGESEDFGEGEEQLERWLKSIRAAVAFLKQTTGVT